MVVGASGYIGKSLLSDASLKLACTPVQRVCGTTRQLSRLSGNYDC